MLERFDKRLPSVIVHSTIVSEFQTGSPSSPLESNYISVICSTVLTKCFAKTVGHVDQLPTIGSGMYNVYCLVF